jgi:hypothetical protein
MRNDGGKRTGIEINGETVLGCFEKGKKPPDSALLWFVDIRCSGSRLPTECEAAREWLLDKAPVIQRALRKLANELQVGIDFSKPVERGIPDIGKGITSSIHCSAIRRLQAGEMANALAETGSHWEALLKSLEVLEPLTC